MSSARSLFPAIFFGCLLSLSSTAQAHFLWVVIDNPAPGEDLAKIYFEHGAAPGDGHYLDHFETRKQVWLQSPALSQPRELTLSEKKTEKLRWLETPIDQGTPRSVDMSATFGVYFYGETPHLLHYYGRFIDVDTRDELKAVSRAAHLKLDLCPEWNSDALELTVFWNDQPSPNREVIIRGPKNFKQKLKSDPAGRVQLTPPAKGRYYIRTSVKLDSSGKDIDGQDYQAITHQSTLIMDLTK